MDVLGRLRSRWKRWLGQKTRIDKPSWVTLLNSNWSGWATEVLDEHQIAYPSALIRSRLKTKELFRRAIECADMRDLRKLDNLYAIERIEKIR